MNRRLFQRCLLWLLPLLLVRAIVPAGFMVAADTNGLALTFCSAQAPLLAAASMPSVEGGHAMQHAGHQMPADAGGVDPHAAHHAGKHFDSPCPFGVAATAMTSDLPVVSLATVVAAVGVFDFVSAPAVTSGPQRADRIRGPPQLS
jgi:hypothetical protein